MADTVHCEIEDNTLHDDSGTDTLYIALDDSTNSLGENVKEEENAQSQKIEKMDNQSNQSDPQETLLQAISLRSFRTIPNHSYRPIHFLLLPLDITPSIQCSYLQ